MRVRVGGGNLAAHSVGVVAPAAGSCGTVVSTLAQGKAQPGRGVAAEAGQAECQQPHGAPAGTGVGWSTGAWPVSTVILIILGGAVVEQAFNTAQAGAILHSAFHGAQTPLSASPTGRQATGGTALLALTATTPLTDERMRAQLSLVLCQDFTKRSIML